MAKTTSMAFAQSLGGRLSELRQELKLHQRDLAKKMGVSERVYRRYEACEQVPGSDKLNSLLDDLKNVHPDWLLLGEGRMFKTLSDPDRGEMILDIIASSPWIERIALLLKGLDDQDLQGILHQVAERKRLQELHSELKSMMRELKHPANTVFPKEPLE